MSSSLLLGAGNNMALVTFLVYTAAVFGLAWLSNRLLQKKSFLSEYFLGSRSLGVWAFALTFAATSASGGSFTGFPSKIYTHGWSLGLWIGSYMVVPICAMGLLGKRLNQVARISGSITVPDVLRDRFRSPLFGLLSVSLIVFFMSFNLVAQFKSGAVILSTLLRGVPMFETASFMVHDGVSSLGLAGAISDVSPSYLLCLLAFGVAVIVYTTYGGFHAVVWTDVMQGVVMVVGVLIMLPLALSQVGGLENATREMMVMKPPLRGTATLVRETADEELRLPVSTWIAGDPGQQPDRIFRLLNAAQLEEGQRELADVELIEIVTEKDKVRIREQYEGEILDQVSLKDLSLQPYKYGADQPGAYVTGPGPSPDSDVGFLPLSLAISFFFMWAISGAGQPSSMVRLMAFKNSITLRRAIFTVSIYYSAIYFPLVIIFCCARVLLPGMEGHTDRVMPDMAVYLTENVGAGWLAGLLIAAPFAAVMSTVDSFLLMISSALVRDIYQRNINPQASEKTIKMLSYLATLIVGSVAMLGAIRPPDFLQDIIVYVGSGLAACFLGPVTMALYWPRVNKRGCIAGLLGGFAAHLSMYVAGAFVNGSFFRPYRVFDFDPIILGLIVSFLTVIVVSLATAPPPEDLVRLYFCKRKEN